MELLQLPDDILLLIIERCDIQGFLQFRLSCRSIHDLICVCWSKILPCITTANYPGAPRLLVHEPSNGDWSLQWLGQIKFKYLATILVDRLRTSCCTNEDGIAYHIPASAPEGDILRSRLANGWLLLDRISKALHKVNLAKHRMKIVQSLRIRARNGDMFGTTRDALLYHDRISETAKLMQTVSETEAVDFFVLWELLRWVFWSDRDGAVAGDRQVSRDRRGTDYFDWGSPLRYGITAGSWTDWLMLYYGPDLFWQQWSLGISCDGAKARSITKDLMIKDWAGREPKQIDGERNTAKMIMKLLWKVCSGRMIIQFGSNGYPNARPYFDEYLRQMKLQKESDEASHVDRDTRKASTMDDIPFLIDFRSCA